MSKVVYGIFSDPNTAAEAVDHLEEVHGGHGTYALVHSDEIDEIPIGGTYSGRWAIMAGFGVGFLGATAAALFLAPAAEVTFGLYEFVSITLAGTLFGLVGGAVSGSSEPLPGLRRASRAVQEGQTVVTVDCDVQGENVVEVADVLADAGASEAAAA
jgi:hypothetical protein